MMKISRYFSMEEATLSQQASRFGLDNAPGPEAAATIMLTADHLDKIRSFLGKPIHVNSWFRCLEVNESLGSKPTSQHVKGEAVDFICPQFGSPLRVAQVLASIIEHLEIDQLIYEHTWVHVSFAVSPHRVPRKEVLTLLSNGKYFKGISTKTGTLIYESGTDST